MVVYKLQRWDIIHGWETIETSTNEAEILHLFRAWTIQLQGGDFRVVKGSRVIRTYYNGVYKLRKGHTIKLKHKRR